ncbi:MAG TPA: porin [Longimicrobiales bacterium]|nr:porin [Longimicrobiales bacterium]
MLRGAAPMLALAVWSAPLAAQAGQVSTRWIGGIQVQYNTTDVAGERPAVFELRRARLGAEMAAQDWITGKLDVDLAGASVVLKDVWVDLAVAPAFQVRVGRFKKPFSVVALTGYAQLVTVERGLRIRGVPADAAEEYDLLSQGGYLGWDTGAAAHGEVGGALSYTVGVFNGAETAGGPRALAARLTAARPGGRLHVSAAVSRQDVPGATGVAWEGDVAWGALRQPGLRLLAEVMAGDNLAAAGAPGMRGAQAAAAWYMPVGGRRVEGLELEGRVSYGDPDTAGNGDEGWLLTPGMAVYLLGRDRLQVNWDVYVPGASGADRHSALIVQLQLVH